MIESEHNNLTPQKEQDLGCAIKGVTRDTAQGGIQAARTEAEVI